MSNKDQISAFLETIPKACKNSELLIAKGIIEGDRSRFPTLVGNVIPHLSLSIETKKHGVSVAKRTIANTSSASRKSFSRHRRTGRSSSMTAKKCRLEGGKVVRTLGGLHFDETIWKSMFREQRDKVLLLRQAESATRVAKVATTSPTAAPLSEVSDKIESLTHAVKSLESN